MVLREIDFELKDFSFERIDDKGNCRITFITDKCDLTFKTFIPKNKDTSRENLLNAIETLFKNPNVYMDSLIECLPYFL